MKIFWLVCVLYIILLAYVSAKSRRGARSAVSVNVDPRSRRSATSRSVNQKSSQGSIIRKSSQSVLNSHVNQKRTRSSISNDMSKKIIKDNLNYMIPKRTGNVHLHLNAQKNTNKHVHQRNDPSTQNKNRSRRSRRYGKASVPKLKFDCSTMPHICNNIREAFDSGHPRYLSRSGTRASINRKIACGGARAQRGMSCDEYPFASTHEGGRGAKTAVVPIEENYSQGGQLSAFYRKYGIKSSGPDSVFEVERPAI